MHEQVLEEQPEIRFPVFQALINLQKHEPVSRLCKSGRFLTSEGANHSPSEGIAVRFSTVTVHRLRGDRIQSLGTDPRKAYGRKPSPSFTSAACPNPTLPERSCFYFFLWKFQFFRLIKSFSDLGRTSLLSTWTAQRSPESFKASRIYAVSYASISPLTRLFGVMKSTLFPLL